MSAPDLPGVPFWVSAASRLIRSLPAGRYRAMNWIASRKAPLFWAALPADFGAFQFQCDLRDPLMREVCITGRYEPQETALLQRLLRPGMTFADVGANWGYFTLGGAHLVGARGRVLSVEADPIALRTLSSNVARNALASVTVIAEAASDGARTVAVRRYEADNDESANFGVAFADALDEDDDGDESELLEVQARPLDAILDEQNVERVDVLKMDIEGAEARALQGLSRRLAGGSVDRVILELHPLHLRHQGIEPEAIVQTLRSLGYDAWRIDHSRSGHRRAASLGVDAASLLTPLTAGTARELDDWPHLLFARRGLGPLDQAQ